MHGEPGIPEQVLHPDQVIGGGECPAQAAFPGVDGKDMAEIIEMDGEEGIGPRCGHLGPRGGSPLKGRKTVGREKEIDSIVISKSPNIAQRCQAFTKPITSTVEQLTPIWQPSTSIWDTAGQR